MSKKQAEQDMAEIGQRQMETANPGYQQRYGRTVAQGQLMAALY